MQVLEVRTENLKSQRSRAEQFSRGNYGGQLPGFSSYAKAVLWIRNFLLRDPTLLLISVPDLDLVCFQKGI
jgi:hypothetical protein